MAAQKGKQLELLKFRSTTKAGDPVTFECVWLPFWHRTKKNNVFIHSGMRCNISRYSYLVLQIVSGKFAREVERRVEQRIAEQVEQGGRLPADQQGYARAVSEIGRDVSKGIDWVAISVDELRAFPALAKTRHLRLRLQEAAEELRHKFEYVEMGTSRKDGFGGGVFNNWAHEAESGTVALELNKWLRYMLYEVGADSTVLSNEVMATLGSTRAMRLYEIFQSFLSTQPVGTIVKKVFPTGDLRLLLGVGPKEYTTHHDFRKRVLSEHVADVNAKTGLHIEFRTVFKDRETFGYEFCAKLIADADPLTPVEKAIVNELDLRHIAVGPATMIARRYDPASVMESIVQVDAYIAKNETATGSGARQRTVGSKTGLLITAIRRGQKMRYGSREDLFRLGTRMAVYCWEQGIPAADRDPLLDRFIDGLNALDRQDARAMARSVQALRDPMQQAAVPWIWEFLLSEHYAVRGRGLRPTEGDGLGEKVLAIT